MRPRTVPEVVCASFGTRGELPAMLRRPAANQAWAPISYRQLQERVRQAALGLLELGLARGERIALIADTCPDWTVADLAIACAGAVSVPLHHLSTDQEVEHAIRHSGARGAIVQRPDHLALARRCASSTGDSRLLIALADDTAGAMSLDDVCALGQSSARELPRLAPEDRYTIIYTSGSTGRPKGCVHTHANYSAAIAQTAALGTLGERDLSYLHLPLAHVFGREVQNLTLSVGGCVAYLGGERSLALEELRELKPTFFASVPRVYEHAYADALALLAERGETLTANDVSGALRARLRGKAVSESHESGPFRAVREIFGGRLRAAWSGAAPIELEVLRFLFACGVPLYEGYGMTETAAACTLGAAGRVKLGTCGRPIPGATVRVADGGEVLVGGPAVFSGYLHDPEATDAALVDGMLRTGDLGSLDEDGYLRIEGRLKDLIITANGKNISPTGWESRACSSPLIEQAVMIGDRRPYLAALIAPAPSAWPAGEHGLGRERIAQVVAAANRDHPSWAQVKRFALLDSPLSQVAGELTVTGKVRRAAIAQSRRALIEEIYLTSQPTTSKRTDQRRHMPPTETTPAQAANVAAIARFFDGISKRNVDDVLSLYVEDCEFTAPEPLPWGGTYRGHDGIQRLFATFMPYWREIEEYAESVISTDDQVMVVVRQRGITRTGAPYDGQLALHFQMKDGKAVRGRGFADTSTVLQAVGAEPRDAVETSG